MKTNLNTYAAIVADAKRISAAHAAAADAAGKDACVVRMHDLYENAKQCLTRDELTRIWAEAFAPKVSGVKRFAGKKFAADHPGAAAPAMPAYITEAQEKRKAEKDAQPKAESKPKAKGKSTKAPAKAKAPTQKDVLAALLVSMNELNTTTKSLTDSVAALDARVAKLEAKKSKKSSK